MNIFSNNTTLTYAVIIVFLGILAAGFSLRHLGRPLNTPVFTAHKLLTIALCALFYFIVRNDPTGFTTNTIFLAMTILAGTGALLLVTSGALLCLDIFPHAIMLKVHNIATGLFTLSGGTMLYLMDR